MCPSHIYPFLQSLLGKHELSTTMICLNLQVPIMEVGSTKWQITTIPRGLQITRELANHPMWSISELELFFTNFTSQPHPCHIVHTRLQPHPQAFLHAVVTKNP